MSSSIVQLLVGDVRVAVMSAAPLTEAGLKEHIEEAVTWDPQVRCVLVEVQPGGILSARDRVALGNAGLLAKPTAVLVESRMTRSILTAVSWLGGQMEAFAPAGLADACDHLGIEGSQRGAIARALATLRQRLKPS